LVNGRSAHAICRRRPRSPDRCLTGVAKNRSGLQLASSANTARVEILRLRLRPRPHCKACGAKVDFACLGSADAAKITGVVGWPRVCGVDGWRLSGRNLRTKQLNAGEREFKSSDPTPPRKTPNDLSEIPGTKNGDCLSIDFKKNFPCCFIQARPIRNALERSRFARLGETNSKFPRGLNQELVQHGGNPSFGLLEKR